MQTIEIPVQSAEPLQPLWDIVEESFEEAEFLWGRWECALDAHDRDLDGVSSWVEERLLGALEGVRVAGDAAIESIRSPMTSRRSSPLPLMCLPPCARHAPSTR